MNMKTKTILLLIGLFAAGVACGILLAPVVHHRQRPEGRVFQERYLARLDDVLELTKSQRERIQVLMKATGDQMAEMRRQQWHAHELQVRSLNAQIASVLDSDQRIRFAKFEREQRERFERRRQRVKPPRPDDPPPPPPEGEER
jgi:hypothetical protein